MHLGFDHTKKAITHYVIQIQAALVHWVTKIYKYSEHYSFIVTVQKTIKITFKWKTDPQCPTYLT